MLVQLVSAALAFKSSFLQPCKPINYLKAGSSSNSDEMKELEIQVLESTQTRLDIQRVSEFLEEDESDTKTLEVMPSWKIAISAGTTSAAVSWFAMHNLVATLVVFAGVSIAASGDPLDEDSVAGALARLLGKFTLQSWKSSQPKLKAVAKAAVQDQDEVSELRARVQELEMEVNDLRLWKRRRVAVDESLGSFSLEELKAMARENRLLVGGTKAQLLMRLVETEIIEL